MKIIKPSALSTGDCVGVVAPSDAVERHDLEKGMAIVRSWGLKIKVGKHVYSRVGDFAAGTAEERSEDLNAMIYDSEVKCIWAATGGYAATEILSVFNPTTIAHLKAQPKFFIGYSDVCLLLNALNSFGLPSVMGPNLSGLYEWDKRTQEEVRKLLTGELLTGIESESNWKPAVTGEAQGRILASNLETLILSFGTRFDPIMYGADNLILCLEELDIDKSTLQRQVDTILNHKRGKRIKAIIVGRLTNIAEVSYPEWGKKVTAEGLITERVKKFGVPLAFSGDFGHPEWVYGKFTQIKYLLSNKRFYPLPNGIQAKLVVADSATKLEYLENLTQLEPKSETKV